MVHLVQMTSQGHVPAYIIITLNIHEFINIIMRSRGCTHIVYTLEVKVI